MGYRTISLGRSAVFYLPSLPISKFCNDAGQTLKNGLEEFLMERFGGFTVFPGLLRGRWKSTGSRVVSGEHEMYSVAFVGKERIPELFEFLADIARRIGEECIYTETGEDAQLVYPDGTVEKNNG